jgi:hypothetical protein
MTKYCVFLHSQNNVTLKKYNYVNTPLFLIVQWLGYWLGNREIVVHFPKGASTFFFSKVILMALGPITPIIQCYK